MEMAFSKTAGCLILAAFCGQAAQFTVRHEHWRKGCEGTLTVDDAGVRFAGPGKHAWQWGYEDIQELRLAPGSIHVLTYKDQWKKLGSDVDYQFTGKVPVDELYPMLSARMNQRLVAEISSHAATRWSLPVKHLLRVSGTEGALEFGADSIVYSTKSKDDSRTWRYADIDSISSSGPFQLTITTYERARSHYGDRKGFNFQLKQPLAEARYNELWLEIEKKNGRIQ
jgi:hypothetical protein